MTPLRQRMLEDMGIRNFAENTQFTYAFFAPLRLLWWLLLTSWR